MSFLQGLARHLDDLGLVTYDAAGGTGDCYLEWLPPDPEAIVTLWQYGGGEWDGRHAGDQVNLQVRARAGDPTTSRDRLTELCDALHDYSGTLPDGTGVELLVVTSGPTPLGADQNGRHEHSASFRAVIRRDAAIQAGRE